MVAATAPFRAETLKTCSLSMTNGVILEIKPGSKVPGVICVAPPDV
jgi:hypothetical protein